MKAKMQKIETKERRNRGITLIALVITIVVLIILSVISMQAIFSDSGIIKQAEKAAAAQANAEASDNEAMGSFLNSITTISGNGNGETEEGNEDEQNEWTVAWTCSNGGSWSEAIPAGGVAEGDIVAKLYTTGVKVPITEDLSLDTYKLIVEGTGKMGTLAIFENSSNVIKEGYAWQKNVEKTPELYEQLKNGTLDTSNLDFNTIPASPFITEVEIKNGIESISSGAFAYCINLPSIRMADSISDIETYAFAFNNNLTSINIPSSLTTIKSYAFFAVGLTSIEIPDNVITIENHAFGWCTNFTKITIGKNVKNIGNSAIGAGCDNLKTVKILVTDYENCVISSGCFGNGEKDLYPDDFWLQDGSTIYVLNEGMKNKLSGCYNPEKTTVKVVTLEEMNQI